MQSLFTFSPILHTKNFGRLLADYAWNLVNLYSVSVTSLAAPVSVYRLKNDYVIHAVSCDGVDTVGVWGSNPHAPTNRFNNLTWIPRFALCQITPLRILKLSLLVSRDATQRSSGPLRCSSSNFNRYFYPQLGIDGNEIA